MLLQRVFLDELVIFVVALPALISPLILVPIPEGWFLPSLLRPLVTALTYPRVWAAAATLVAGMWMIRGTASRGRKALGASIVLLSWAAACHTASVLAAWDRF